MPAADTAALGCEARVEDAASAADAEWPPIVMPNARPRNICMDFGAWAKVDASTGMWTGAPTVEAKPAALLVPKECAVPGRDADCAASAGRNRLGGSSGWLTLTPPSLAESLGRLAITDDEKKERHGRKE